MHVLIVESREDLASQWAERLREGGITVHVTHSQECAVRVLCAHRIQVVMLDLMLDEGSALAVADFAAFRQPWAKVVFLTDTAVFSDGSIFSHCQNACGYFAISTPVNDLATIVEHYVHAA
ncbi:response regulator [Cereibacter azotoformans]|uniref:Response regulator receiver domain-containing protein n=2 Tax=Cereibacter TaxID=1653176 RepID=A0A2T5KE94_9RHOB|nr:response regulator [Cereibacter azotoformans]AXQ92435.1 response regulator [Cereibacter sphaeroides]MBO4169992.1 response regulator [Cereibacter azotoformans]PTR20745.1 response regulator receiver domain-containing protein [Cereibacter azotoformans]UIJ30710.1 response regulator [Cereibacter azotoformans]ULB08457.1 response regulator [Cereibacter azotoformans]